MSYDKPQQGGAADSYYQQQGQQDYAMQNQQQYPPQGQQYQAPNGPPPQQYQQYPPPQQQQQYNGPPKQQYAPPPPQNGNGKQDGPPEYGSHSFAQSFKVDKPKYNDLWAAILFLLAFGGFVAVSGLALHGYSSTNQGGGIYNSGASEVGLNSNTIILFAFVLGTAFVLSFAYFWLIRVATKQYGCPSIFSLHH